LKDRKQIQGQQTFFIGDASFLRGDTQVMKDVIEVETRNRISLRGKKVVRICRWKG